MKLLSVKYHISCRNRGWVLTRLVRSGLLFSRPVHTETGLSFYSSVFAKKKTLDWAKASEYEIEWEYAGLLAPILELKHRPGIIFGGIFGLFLIYLSTFFIWSVRIEGNEALSDDDVITLLRECGFGEGARKGYFDTNEIQNDALTRNHALSFLSINVHGMVADVEVFEKEEAPQDHNTRIPYNLVSDSDGVILSTLVLNGQTVVEVGDTVVKGQLLVSGLVDSSVGSARLVGAEGRVLARTHKTFTLTQPLTVTEKIYTDEDISVGVRLLGKTLSLGRVPRRECDTRLDEKPLSLLSLSLPVTLETRHHLYYYEEEVTIDEERAQALLLKMCDAYISANYDSAQIEDKTESFAVSDGKMTMTVDVTAIENIAIKKRINVNTLMEGTK